MEQFDLFVEGCKKHRLNHASLLFLLDRFSLLNDIQRRLELVRKVSEPDRRLTLNIYNETSDHLIPEKNKSLEELKKIFLKEIEYFMVNNGIAYNKRAREQVILERDIIKHKSIIHQIEEAPLSQQYALTQSSLTSINAAAFELEKIL